jgi:hypothetical protein
MMGAITRYPPGPAGVRRRALWRVAWLAGIPALLVVGDLSAQQAPPAMPPAPVDTVPPVFRRAQRLINDGNGAEGRAVLDSVLEATEPRSGAEAVALYWRATLAESWDNAQRDYLRIMLEHDRTPMAAAAMLRLAQGELARGDRDAAVRYLERLAREAPESPLRPEAALWHGRLLVERGLREEGCAVLRAGRLLVRPGALEQENQYEYLLRGCPEAPPAAADAQPPAGVPPRTPVPAPPTAVPAPQSGPAWSVQVAAFSTRGEAEAMVTRLKARGYDARVDGTAPPFRVRFGRFATRAEAGAASENYKARERADAFIVEVPRG